MDKITQGTIKRGALLAYLRVCGFITTDREMRITIEEAVMEGELIRSSSNGYSIIKSEAELHEAILYLKKKAFPLFARANALLKSFTKKQDISKQQFISFEEFLT